MEEITVERRVGVRVCAVPFGGRERHERPQRAFRLTFRRFPVQAVLLTGIANKLQSILFGGCTIVRLREVLGLSGSRGFTNVDDCQFVPADTTI